MEEFKYQNSYQSNYFITKDYTHKKKLRKYRDTRTHRQRYLQVMHPDVVQAVQGQVTIMISIILVVSLIGAAIILHDIQQIQALDL